MLNRDSFQTYLILLSEPPGTPTKPEVYDVTCQSCKLAWDQPEKNGGSKITNYLVECKMISSYDWEQKINVDAQTFCTVIKDLRQGVSVQFRIKAVNKAGVGKPGQESPVIHPVGRRNMFYLPIIRIPSLSSQTKFTQSLAVLQCIRAGHFCIVNLFTFV